MNKLSTSAATQLSEGVEACKFRQGKPPLSPEQVESLRKPESPDDWRHLWEEFVIAENAWLDASFRLSELRTRHLKALPTPPPELMRHDNNPAHHGAVARVGSTSESGELLNEEEIQEAFERDEKLGVLGARVLRDWRLENLPAARQAVKDFEDRVGLTPLLLEERRTSIWARALEGAIKRARARSLEAIAAKLGLWRLDGAPAEVAAENFENDDGEDRARVFIAYDDAFATTKMTRWERDLSDEQLRNALPPHVFDGCDLELYP